MFAFGYAMLYGNCCVSVVGGAHLDPDLGMLHEGGAGGSFVHDLIEPQKASMVDRAVIRFAREEISSGDYECGGEKRCYLGGEISRPG
ncbi:CRISPR-associated endonuclease Cas1 [Methanoculleus chikugoensis]|uniref:CRISPR-associated endonuclease Cas1 n=1 Tax=Methanoculleus chikugoensis TaxID=118126 RepID=UPI000AFCDE61|nr:CRISPR-associated endonuclease Cas1 [Methanoculleus chikugoensis]